MATTISLPTQITGGPASFNGSNMFADNGLNTSGLWQSGTTDVTIRGFNQLTVPTGATINGIEVVVNGQGNTGAGAPSMRVYNGDGWSNSLEFQGIFGKGNAEYDPGWGSSSNLWGLEWTTSAAQEIQIQVDNSSIQPTGTQMYWDWVRVRITFTPGEFSNGTISLIMGKVSLTEGAITI